MEEKTTEEKILETLTKDIDTTQEAFQGSAKFAELMKGNLPDGVMSATYADAMDMTIAMRLGSGNLTPQERYTLIVNRIVVLTELAKYYLREEESKQGTPAIQG